MYAYNRSIFNPNYIAMVDVKEKLLHPYHPEVEEELDKVLDEEDID